jgi:hypothetical protein
VHWTWGTPATAQPGPQADFCVGRRVRAAQYAALPMNPARAATGSWTDAFRPDTGNTVRCTANEPGAHRDWQLDGRFPARFRQNRTLHCQCNRRPPRLAAGRMPSGLARQFDRAPLGPADSRRRDRLQTGEGAVAATRHRRSRDRWCRGRRQSVRCCVPRSCCSSRPCRRSFNFDWKDTSTATRRSAATTVASLRALHGYGPSTLRPRPGARPWQSAARPAGIGPEW